MSQAAFLSKIVNESEVERVYHSLAEMPPEIRAAIAEADKKIEGVRDRRWPKSAVEARLPNR